MNLINLKTTRGSDVKAMVTLNQPDGTAVDLTGQTVDVFDESVELEGRVTAEIYDAIAGKVLVRIEGSTPIALGVYKFRVQLNGADSLGYPEFRLSVE